MKFIKMYLVCSLLIGVVIVSNSVSANQQIKTLSLANMNLVNVDNSKQIKSKQALQSLTLKEQNIDSVKFLSGKRRRALENYINGEWSLKAYDDSGEILFEYIAIIESTLVTKSGFGIFLFNLLDNARTSVYSVGSAGFIAGDGLALHFSLPWIFGGSLAQISLLSNGGFAAFEVNRDCIISNDGTEFSCKSRLASEVINVLTPLTMEKIK